MNSHTLLENNGNILPIPARLPFSPTRSYPLPPGGQSGTVSRGIARLVPESGFDGWENLYSYATRAQRRTESVERLAFAALAGSGIAGILSAFI